MNKQEIDQKYINQANQLEAEFFDIIPEFNEASKQIGQHRQFKAGKDEAEFKQRHGDIWRNHEEELIAEGFMQPRPPPEPVRDLVKERMDALEARIAQLEGS